MAVAVQHVPYTTRLVSEMTYYVSSVTLNSTTSTQLNRPWGICNGLASIAVGTPVAFFAKCLYGG